MYVNVILIDYNRAVGRSENPGVPVVMWGGGHNLPLLVDIGLTDLPKYGNAMAPPAPTGPLEISTYLKVLEHFLCA